MNTHKEKILESTCKISIVSPVYRGEKMVAELVRRNIEALSTITDDYEIILVNDASPDESWSEIVKECKNNSKVKGLNLSQCMIICKKQDTGALIKTVILYTILQMTINRGGLAF